MKPELEIYRHVDAGRVPDELLAALEAATIKALPNILDLPKGPEHVLSGLQTVEISIVDDTAIGEIHGEFLNDPAPTDVITFPHGDGLGEIIVSVDTAVRQAEIYHEPWRRELFRYMVHGLLHLHGYLDGTKEQRDLMFSYQEPLVGLHWVGDED